MMAKQPKSNSFANRIVGYGVKDADQFTFNPRNPRSHPQHQRDAMRQSLNKVGWVGPVIESVNSGYVIDGHERIWQALDTNSEVPYVQVDLTEEEEALVLATYDPLTYMADTNADMLANLLNQVEAQMPDMSGLLEVVAAQMEVPIMPKGGFQADLNESRLDEKNKITCPECGHIFYFKI